MKIETDIEENAELQEEVLSAVNKNHIWINAFSLVRPNDETYIRIGKAVVEMLQARGNLLPHYYGPHYDGPITDMQKLTPVLYLSVNAS